MRWTFYPLLKLPAPLDVVWCRFPLEEAGLAVPGPKARPALVRSVLLTKDHQRAYLEVTYGTSKRRESERPLDLHICNLSEMDAAGLPQATCFVLARTVRLPWAHEFFTIRDDGTGPIIGHLPPSALMQLEALKVQRRQKKT